MSDTPETDAFFFRIDIDWDMEVEFAKKLERERDEARSELDNMQDQRDLAMKVISRLERERDDAREELSKILKNE